MKEIEIYGKKYQYKVSNTYDIDLPVLSAIYSSVTIFYDDKEKKKDYFFSSKNIYSPKYAFHIFHDIESKDFKNRKDWNKILKKASDEYLDPSNGFIVKDPNIKY